MPKVYGAPLSPFVRKVRVALLHKGVEHDLDPILPTPPHNDDPDFRAMSPLGKVPAYRDGEFAISDSSVILDYIERTHPEPAIYPGAPQQRARAMWLEELADTKIIEGVGPVFFNRLVAPTFFQQDPDEEAIAAALESLPPHWDYLESQLEGDFLVGDAFSVADIAVGSVLRQFTIAGESVDGERWPKLSAYAQRMAQHPAFAAAAEGEAMGMPGATA